MTYLCFTNSVLTAVFILGILTVSIFAQDVTVVDGDTLIVDGIKFRLEGIDAPEAGQTCNLAGEGTWKCGKKAAEALVALTAGKRIVCDNRALGEYGRTLSVCHAGETELNKTMVERGFAWAYRNRFKDYSGSESAARAKLLGIWQAPSQSAEDYRTESWKLALKQSPPSCPIKGKVTNEGGFYHTPWSPSYSRIKIDRVKGDRWFCSEAQAIRAGWFEALWNRSDW